MSETSRPRHAGFEPRGSVPAELEVLNTPRPAVTRPSVLHVPEPESSSIQLDAPRPAALRLKRFRAP